MVTALGYETTRAALTAVEGLLGRRVGASVDLGEPEDLGGSGRTLVMRVRVLHNNPLLPRSVVIKQLRAADHTDKDYSEAFAREGAAYKFATALPVDARPGPQLLASDAEERILVLQDLGEGETMGDLLRRTPSSGAATVLSAWAQALGRMHAGTYGRERDLSVLARREHTDSRNDPIAGEAARAADAVPAAEQVVRARESALTEFATRCAALGCSLGADPRAAVVDLLALRRALASGGAVPAPGPSGEVPHVLEITAQRHEVRAGEAQ